MVVIQISAATPKVVSATYKRQQTMLETQRRLNFLPEILFQATTVCDNSIAGPSKKTWGLGGDDLKTTKNATKAT